MRKALLSAALAIAFAGVIAFSAYREFEEPASFKGCFEHEGKSLVLSEGRLMVDGVDVGSFRYSRGDATKGSDNIGVSASPDMLKSIGLDPRRLWLVGGKGIQLPIENGGYQTALPCRA